MDLLHPRHQGSALTASPSRTLPDSAAQASAAALLARLAILLTLIVLAFREEVRSMIGTAGTFSEWSHMLAWPVVAAFLIRCRWNVICNRRTMGSGWGLLLVLAGFALWFASASCGVFLYATQFALLVCAVGAVVVAGGWGVLRVCLPVLLAAWLCLPLSERSMERFSIPVQRISFTAASVLVDVLPSIDVRLEGTMFGYSHRAQRGYAGLGEQRFGMRLIAASLMLCLAIAFSRPRSLPHLLILGPVGLLVVFVTNVLRICTWAVTEIYGGFAPTSTVPRNISMAVALVATYVLFAAATYLTAKAKSLADLFLTDDPEETASPTTSPAPGQTGGRA